MRLFFTYGQKTCLINIGPFLVMAGQYRIDYYPNLWEVLYRLLS